MAKQVSLTELETQFLAHVQQEPGCEGVTQVRIVPGHRLGSSAGWKVVDWKGDSDDVAVEHALKSGYRKFDGEVTVQSQ